jgi:hypothetical protein
VLSDDTTLTVEEGEVATIAIAPDGTFEFVSVSGGDGQVTLSAPGGSTEVGPSPPISLWDFVGFAPPVANGANNPVKAGSTVPLKWQLLSETGIAVANLASVTATLTPVDCLSGLPTGTAAAIAGSALKLKNLGGGYYNLSWATDKGAAGCKLLLLSLAGEGPLTHEVRFRFTWSRQRPLPLET